MLALEPKPRLDLCHGKICFLSWQDAERYSRIRNFRGGGHTEPYHCKECNYFHLRTPVKKIRKPVKNGRKSRQELLEE